MIVTHPVLGNMTLPEARQHLHELKLQRASHPEAKPWLNPLILQVERAVDELYEEQRRKIGPQPSRWSVVINSLLAFALLFLVIRLGVFAIDALIKP